MTPSYRELTLEYSVRDGGMGRGIVCEPVARASRATLVLLSAGLKYRVGPGRLYVELARHFAQEGFRVIRADPSQIGESDGRLESAPIQEIWNTIERGRFVDDGIALIGALRQKCGEGPIFVSGLCGGAVTAEVIAHAKPRLVQGVVALNPAITLSTGSGRPVRAVAKANARTYVKRLVSPFAWQRLLSGISNYRLMWATARTMLGTVPQGVNPLYFSALQSALSAKIPHLLIFAENDERWHEFKDLILKQAWEERSNGDCYQICVVPEANHEFHWRPWREALARHFLEWAHMVANV